GVCGSPDAAAPGTATFDETGTPQDFVVPTGVTHVTIVANGAPGDGCGTGPLGNGGTTTATIPVTPGETLVVMVGGIGKCGGSGGTQSSGGEASLGCSSGPTTCGGGAAGALAQGGAGGAGCAGFLPSGGGGGGGGYYGGGGGGGYNDGACGGGGGGSSYVTPM